VTGTILTVVGAGEGCCDMDGATIQVGDIERAALIEGGTEMTGASVTLAH